MALNASRYAAVVTLRGDMGWSTFRERYTKAALRYKAGMEHVWETSAPMNDAVKDFVEKM